MNDIQHLPSLGLRDDLSALSGHLAAGRLSSAALTARYLHSIDRDNTRLGAFTFVAAEAARAAARESDARRAAGVPLGALDGIPVALKANIAVRGWPYTAGLRFRQQEIAAQDAFLVRRLRAAGAVLLGLTNMDEGALGAEGMNPWYLTTQNPLRAGYCAGGSSSGSAAAVAADLCAFAVGTDTIGSLRIPAAFCGCASIKPSFGFQATISLRCGVPTLCLCTSWSRSRCQDPGIQHSSMGNRFPTNNLADGAQVRRNGLVHELRPRTAWLVLMSPSP